MNELLIRTIVQFLNIIMFLILAQAAMSWFVRDNSNPIFKFLTDVTQPFLVPFQMILNRIGLNRGLDFSPIFALLTLQFISNFFAGLVY